MISPVGNAYVFNQDYVFNSPSTAAGVIQGRTANGRKIGRTRRIERYVKSKRQRPGRKERLMYSTGNDDNGIPTLADDTSHQSTFYEQLVEHVFISEVLQEVWYGFGKTIEVLRSEVDTSGYNVIFECDGILRHVQLKTSKADAKLVARR